MGLSVATSLNTFVAITTVQIIVFIVKPELCGDFIALEPQYIQLIGLKEISLMYLYYNIVQSKQRALAWMVTVGRILTIPCIIYLVGVVGAPLDMLGGIVLDVTFGTWTMLALRSDKEWLDRFPAAVPQRPRTFLSFLVLASIGLAESVSGAIAMFQPESIIGNTAFLPLPNPPIPRPYVTLRSFGLMTMLTGLYQIRLASCPSLSNQLWSIICRYHILFCLTIAIFSFLAEQSEEVAFRPPLLHLAASGVLTTYVSMSGKASEAEGSDSDLDDDMPELKAKQE